MPATMQLPRPPH